MDPDRLSRIPKRIMNVMYEETQEIVNEFLNEVASPDMMLKMLQSMGLDSSKIFTGGKEQMAFDPYKVIGLDRTASDDDVKERYNDLIRKLHPDTAGTQGTDFLFQMVHMSYEMIKEERGIK